MNCLKNYLELIPIIIFVLIGILLLSLKDSNGLISFIFLFNIYLIELNTIIIFNIYNIGVFEIV